ncbi:hypothetical protein BLL52_0882 [Rhodoferax antarcticus ANT.BR]|uniref:Uncharacterized protein n=1 Tax=Rhodoferax antarcticus ANT.BR TaxID=1111071 RepID=A0A1Q8YID8_9BURK|nr:hypothetical protein BLL52_0882 [Rhodoferax antarcticus ANT.BR]
MIFNFLKNTHDIYITLGHVENMFIMSPCLTKLTRTDVT